MIYHGLITIFSKFMTNSKWKYNFILENVPGVLGGGGLCVGGIGGRGGWGRVQETLHDQL